MDNELFNTLIKETENEYAAIVDEGVAAGDVSGFIGTGSLSLNGLVSGTLYGGIPANKVTAIAGEPATGKTFYAINLVRQFLIDNPTGFVFYFESESAISKDMMADRGVDVKRVAIIPVATVQEFRTQAIKILDRYMDKGAKKAKSAKKPPMLFVLDSLGNLSTNKEMEDISAGKDTRDMTRAQLIRAAFRVLTLKLGVANVALFVTNHVYDVVGSYVPTKKMGGGSGLEYAASTIIFLSKKKDKDAKTKDVTGSIVTAKVVKARLTIPDKKVETLLDFQKGLDPYYGLLPLALRYGIFKKVSTKIQINENGESEFEVNILKNPEKYFTKEVLDKIDAGVQKDFRYGGEAEISPDFVEEDEGEEE